VKAKVAVELYGGPMDGHRAVVPVGAQVHIFKDEETGEVHAYQWAARAADGGKVWVMRWLRGVGKCGFGNKETNEPNEGKTR
jgi:hypothetical protein